MKIIHDLSSMFRSMDATPRTLTQPSEYVILLNIFLYTKVTAQETYIVTKRIVFIALALLIWTMRQKNITA